MTWQFIIVLVLAIPVILFPIALIWFLDIDGIVRWVKRSRKRRELQSEDLDVVAPVEQQIDS
jgi:hypothetical protein